MYSNSFGGYTQTFIDQDVDFLTKKYDLLYICNPALDFKTEAHNTKAIGSYPLDIL